MMNKDLDTKAKVLRVRATDGGARLCLTIEHTDGERTERETLALYTSRLSHTPRVGEIDGELLAYYRREEMLARALDLGLRSLGSADGSKEQLVRKLRAKRVSSDVAREAVCEISARGLLCEEDAAVRAAERGMAKLWGNKRILADLCAKGYGADALDAAKERLAMEDAVARCRNLLRKRGIHEPPRDVHDAQKLIASLLRYGYSTGEIRAAFEKE